MSIDRYEITRDEDYGFKAMAHEDGLWVTYEDHIDLVAKIIMFYGLPPDKQKSAETLGLAHLFKEMDHGKEESIRSGNDGEDNEEEEEDEA